ncbi:MAG: hypothetical protein KJ964_04730 [Verrucomicrobia bacterium]|nr:hypothetical protein [Verrucomicrobiota bacterium]MBU1735653.1 hypothetical protein [Verrucomicrobiota bacterium]MBU1856683.1 hypothetical protein [Verrucomicrobiota bacterium]
MKNIMKITTGFLLVLIILVLVWISLPLLTGMLKATDAKSSDKTMAMAFNPFHAKQIEVTPGGRLMLRPRIVYVEGLPDSEYTLVLDVPDFLLPSNRVIAGTDISDYKHIMRIDPVQESIRDIVADGKIRKEISYQPDFSIICDGIDLSFGYKNKKGGIIDYFPIIRFLGTFDWKSYSKTITVQAGVYSADALILKWPFPANTASGTLSFRNLQVKEADTGKIFYTCEKTVTATAEHKKLALWLTPDNEIPLVPGKQYIVSCEAKGDDIKSDHMTSSETLKKDELRFWTRTFIWDIAAKANLPDQINWRLTDKAGKIYREGQVLLVKSMAYQRPKRLETSVWIAETQLPSETMPVRELFLEKFREWGFNTTMPALADVDIASAKIDYIMPIAQESKRLGMKVRLYISHYWYMANASAAYCKFHPEYASVTWKGDQVPGPRVCFTHVLDGGKYDEPANPVAGGDENPWLKLYLDTLKEYVRVNKIDGIWIDHEITAAPYPRIGQSGVNYDASRPRQICLCQRCRKALKEFSGLDHVPTGEECCGVDLFDKVVDFKCRQNILLWQFLKKAIKQANPAGTFGIYSGSLIDGLQQGGKPGQYCRENYGVDWRKAAPTIDIASIRICGRYPAYTDFRDTFAAGPATNSKAMPQIIHSVYTPFYSAQRGSVQDALYPEFKNTIILLVVKDGSVGGWSFTGVFGMDDQLATPIREANDLLAKYEDVITEGQRADKEVEFPEKDVINATWRGKDRLVTFVFNTGDKSRKIELVLKTKDRRVVLDVPAHDCLVQEW